MVRGAVVASRDHRKLVEGLGRRSWSLLADVTLNEAVVAFLARRLYA
jgi:hypothetical protein